MRHFRLGNLSVLLSLLLIIFGAFLVVAEGEQIITLPDGVKVVLYSDFTWQYYGKSNTDEFDFSTLSPNTLPSFLRQGIRADVATQRQAVEMYLQGWRYTMPMPKSSQASWGNSDGRTTWYYGYWYNASLDQVSKSEPVKKENGLYYGDEEDLRYYYRTGGCPQRPTKLQWLLSESGGVKP